MVGSLVGHFKILDLLGKGGMGEVYRAEDTTLGRTVAIKFLAAELIPVPKGDGASEQAYLSTLGAKRSPWGVIVGTIGLMVLSAAIATIDNAGPAETAVDQPWHENGTLWFLVLGLLILGGGALIWWREGRKVRRQGSGRQLRITRLEDDAGGRGWLYTRILCWACAGFHTVIMLLIVLINGMGTLCPDPVPNLANHRRAGSRGFRDESGGRTDPGHHVDEPEDLGFAAQLRCQGEGPGVLHRQDRERAGDHRRDGGIRHQQEQRAAGGGAADPGVMDAPGAPDQRPGAAGQGTATSPFLTSPP